jgi:AcrR family transcriptional regulator
MTRMSTPYELTGRARQKQRTRDALVDAARHLVATGLTPSVAEAAERAGVSRTSAYRYFPSQRSLLMAAHPETATTSLLPPDPPTGVAERLEAVVRAFTDLIVETEMPQRTMLRLSLEADPAERERLPLRQGRAIGWIAEALSPLEEQLGKDRLHLLALAIRSATGIEALAWLTDVAGLSRREATDLMRWSAQALLQTAVADGSQVGVAPG